MLPPRLMESGSSNKFKDNYTRRQGQGKRSSLKIMQTDWKRMPDLKTISKERARLGMMFIVRRNH